MTAIPVQHVMEFVAKSFTKMLEIFSGENIVNSTKDKEVFQASGQSLGMELVSKSEDKKSQLIKSWLPKQLI